MFKKVKPQASTLALPSMPHCDQRILHAPGECEYCDAFPTWQQLRIIWGIAFTGYSPEERELPCPADYARGDAHKLWSGNIARPAEKEKSARQTNCF
jgi:hypothetical protein